MDSHKTVTTSTGGSERFAVPASRYDFKQLADIYNQARVDYIVPMPMNARRMEEYVHTYDIDLDASVVALNSERDPCGVGMVGVRGDRTWITRLGVIPERRGYRLGQYLMEQMIESSLHINARRIQLEVIVGNEPAYRLFQKLGFVETRILLIVRRPPGQMPAHPLYDAATVTEIAPADIPAYLEQREPGASWVEETQSLLNARQLCGLHLELPSGERSWIVFQRTPFQLTHFVLGPASMEATGALLHHVHRAYPNQDTKIENVPEQDRHWPAFQEMGYMEVFRRIEMVLELR